MCMENNKINTQRMFKKKKFYIFLHKESIICEDLTGQKKNRFG